MRKPRHKTVFITFFALMIIVIGLPLVNTSCSTRPPGYPYHVNIDFDVHDPQFIRTMNSLLGPPLVGGNSVETLVNGDAIFPAMLEAIRGAERTITFETYIYWTGKVAIDFADALAERARAGVKVHVIIDGFGGLQMDDDLVARMEDAGVEFERFRPLNWWQLHKLSRVNNRTHRKILVVDGLVGFTGGVGIAEQWEGDAGNPEEWRDSHYRITGPAVAQLQSAFTEHWVEVRNVVLTGDDYFPEITEAGPLYGQVFKSDHRGGSSSMQIMFLLSMAAASSQILLAHSYFVPDDLTIEALLDARKRGVTVKVITPGPHQDVPMVRQASRHNWKEMLEAGVEIYEYQPTMYHTKLIVIDEVWVSIGSANLDNRSFHLNDEANLNVYDREFALEQVRIFEEDLKHSRRITLEEWEDRSTTRKIKDWAAGLLRHHL